MASWKSIIQQTSTKVLMDINLKCYEISWYLFTQVVKFSPSPSNPGPTAKGLLANQWYPQAGSPSSAKSTSKSPTGSGSLARINAMMGGTEFYLQDGKMTLSNNLDYAVQAEKLGWYPPEWAGVSGSDRKGAPYRMVSRGLQATVAKYKKVKI